MVHKTKLRKVYKIKLRKVYKTKLRKVYNLLMGECQREREPLQVVSPDLHCQEKINVFSATGTEGWDLFCFLNFLRFFYFYFLLN